MAQEDNYYNYQEEATQPNDNKPTISNLQIWLIWLRVWVTPRAGWKALRQSRISSDRFAATCFYPTLALAAAGAFMALFYHADLSISDIIRKATEIFVSFFLAYFAFNPVAKIFMSKKSRECIDSDFAKCYAAMLLSTLAFFYFLLECVPFMEPAFAFTPLYTIFLAYKGVHTLRIPSQDTTLSLSLICATIIGLPLLLSYIFNLIMPQ